MGEGEKETFYYKGFRLRDIGTPRYRHVFMVLWWAIYSPIFMLVGKHAYETGIYTVIHSTLDDMIPFQEGFILFYDLWYGFVAGMLVYALLFDVQAFKKGMWSFILFFTSILIVCIVFPTGHDFQPKTFPRDNFLTDLVKILYSLDRPTNILPSEHVIGAWIVVFMASDSKKLSKPWILSLFIFAALGITLSVVFVKQHSVVDVFAAIPVIVLCYFVCFFKGDRSPVMRASKKLFGF